MKFKSVLMTVAIMATVSGCTPTINTRGNLVPDSKMQKVQPNITTQYDINNLFGPPTVVAPFNDNAQGSTWYYAGHTSERLGVFKYEITDRKLIEVDFDENGVVTAMRALDPDNAREIDFVSRETPTAGREYTMLQQFVGNIGRFNGMGASGAVKSQPGNQ